MDGRTDKQASKIFYVQLTRQQDIELMNRLIGELLKKKEEKIKKVRKTEREEEQKDGVPCGVVASVAVIDSGRHSLDVGR